MTKPIYYIHKDTDSSEEEIDDKIKLFQKAGFRVVVIRDGEESDFVSCIRTLLCNKFS